MYIILGIAFMVFVVALSGVLYIKQNKIENTQLFDIFHNITIVSFVAFLMCLAHYVTIFCKVIDNAVKISGV